MNNENIFIGREEQLKELNSSFQKVKSGKGKLLLIEGNAGIGKSGIVREFLKQFKGDPTVLVGSSECNDKENLNAFAPFKDVLIDINTQSLKKSDKNFIVNFKNFISDAGSSWIELIPVIGSYAKVGIETYEAYNKAFNTKETPEIESEKDVFRIFENEFRRLSEDKTLIIFIDDLQWADAASLNLIFGLGKAIRSNPFKILFIGSFRPNDIKAGRNKISETGATVNVAHPFEDKLNMLKTYTKNENHIQDNPDWFQEIILPPFNKKEVKELINVKFSHNKFTDTFYEDIYKITDGHPLFVVEILSYLFTKGLITEQEGIYNCASIALENLPASIDGVISEKVDRLNKDLFKVLTYASVNGEEFAFQIIEKILDMDDDEKEDLLVDYLEELSHKHGLLIEKDSQLSQIDIDLFSFTQTLVHKFVYENMSNLKRKRLHRKVANIMKELYGDILEVNKNLKDKYNLHKQIGQGLIDGVTLQLNSSINDESKTTKSENDEVIDVTFFIDAAIVEIENAKDSFKLYAMNETFDFVNKALAFLTKVDKDKIAYQKNKYAALQIRAEAQQWMGYYQKAYNTAEELYILSKLIDDEKRIATANYLLGNAKLSLGYNVDALSYLTKALTYFQSTNDLQNILKVSDRIAILYNDIGSYKEAIEISKKAITLSENSKNPLDKGIILLNLGKSYSSMLAEPTTIMECFNEALSIFKKLNNKYWIGNAYNKIGLEYRSIGDNDKAIEILEKALQIATEQNDLVRKSNYNNNIALTYEATENFDKAIEYYFKSLEIDTKLDDIPMIAKSWNNIGSVYASTGKYKIAIEYLNKAYKITKEINNPKELATIYNTMAMAYEKMNENEKTIDFYLKAITIYEQIEDKASLAINFYLLGNIYYSNNNYESAHKYLTSSLNNFKELGNELFIAITNNHLGLTEHNLGNYENASVFYKLSLQYYKKINDEENQIDILENLVNNFSSLKQFSKVFDTYKEAIAISEKNNNKNILSKQYNGIAETLYWTDQFELAVQYYLKALEVNKELFGERSNEAAREYENIGYCYLSLSKYDKAIEYHKLALNIYKNIFGHKAKETDKSINNLARSYYMNDEDETAKKLFLTSLEFRKEHYGEESDAYKKTLEYIQKINVILTKKEGEPIGENPYDSNQNSENTPIKKLEKSIEDEFISYFELGQEEFKNKQFNKAITNYNLALETSNLLPKKDLNFNRVAEVYFKIAEVYNNQKNYDKAISNYILSYNTYLEVSTINYSNIGKVCSYLGDMYFFQNKHGEAIENHKDSLKYYTKSEGKKSIMVGWANYDLGEDYYWSDQYELSISHFEKALEIRKDINGRNHDGVAACYIGLGNSYLLLDKEENALTNYQEAYSIYKILYGSNHSKTDKSLFKMGKAFYYIQNIDKATECLYASLHYRKETYGEGSKTYQQAKKWIEEHLK